MKEQLESNYDCAQAGDDLHSLLQELESYNSKSSLSPEEQQLRNRLENQIHFIRNKCGIPGEG